MKRNFTLVGHAHVGKTTLAESILYVTGTTSRKGEVMQGTTVSDYNDDEIDRKISINSSYLQSSCNGHAFQIIDTPGYSDFIGETVAALRAVDAAVVVVDAVNGVEVGTEDVWQRLNNLGLPRMIFINKTDKSDAKVDEVLASIQEQLSRSACLIDLNSSELIEAVAETDDKLLEKYLETGSLSGDEVKTALRKAILQTKIFPVFKGSALSDEGVKELLEAVIAYFPSPLERKAYRAKDPETHEDIEVVPVEDGPFAGMIFKSLFDPHLGQLSLMRVLRGNLTPNTDFYNVTAKSKEHVSTVNFLQGKEQSSASVATVGDVVALPKLKNSHVSDVITDPKNKVILDPIPFPEPSISASIKPRTRADEEKISTSLHRLCEEDHTVRVSRDEESKEMILSGIGDLHLKIILGRMKNRYNVEVDLGRPKVCYRETILKKGQARHKYKKQSGGRGQYGDVELVVEPLQKEGEEEFEFVNQIFGGAIPRNYIPSVEKGVRQAISDGVIANSPLINIKVTVVDGSYHTVDSSDMAFQIASALAFKEAVQAASPVLLEPVMEVLVVIPDEFIGDISGDISSRRGKILGGEARGKNQMMKAQVPLSEMFSYATDLRSLTGGRGSYTMKFSHYEQAPAKVTAQVIAQKQKTE